MHASFRFYGALNDFLPAPRRHRTVACTFTNRASVKDMIEALGIPHTEIEGLTVNGDFGISPARTPSSRVNHEGHDGHEEQPPALRALRGLRGSIAGVIDFRYIVRDGDRVAADPPFHVLDPGDAGRLRLPLPRDLRFVADVHLGRLAAYLRLPGFDTDYRTTTRTPLSRRPLPSAIACY
jgi:hypothetical protein